MFFTSFALRHFVNDYELGDVSVSLVTVQLRCAFIIYLCTFLFDTEVVFVFAYIGLAIAKWSSQNS